jgi:hypothetical protein
MVDYLLAPLVSGGEREATDARTPDGILKQLQYQVFKQRVKKYLASCLKNVSSSSPTQKH